MAQLWTWTTWVWRIYLLCLAGSVVEKLFEIWLNSYSCTITAWLCEQLASICSLCGLNQSVSTFWFWKWAINSFRGQAGTTWNWNWHFLTHFTVSSGLFFPLRETGLSRVIPTYNFLNCIFYLFFSQWIFCIGRIISAWHISRMRRFQTEIILISLGTLNAFFLTS